MWLLYALTGPVFWAASTHIDKYLVERYFKDSDTAVLMVFTALIGIVMLPFIAAFVPGVFTQKPLDIVVMAITGVLYMGAMLFYLRALQTEEASVVAPLFQTSTLFTFAIGYVVLGEVLTWVQIGGAVLIIAGALVLSLDSSLRLRTFKPRLMMLMSLCSLVLAFSSVLFKYFAVHDEFWVTTFWIFVGEAVFGAGILAVGHYRRQFFDLFRESPGPIMAINGANELINLGAGLGVRFAALLAPVALVSAVASTTTLWVFLIGIGLTSFFPKLGREDLSRRNLLQKGAGAVLIGVGVALVNLTRVEG